ncbi:YrdB family protein [uncultured Microbacterium sp.]|uniref:YrdB family protein n=1 Tax=uncultured Microbacterium sp. TaxID=191216 RepID=UPI00345987EA
MATPPASAPRSSSTGAPKTEASTLPAGMVERPGFVDIVRFVVELVAFGSLAYWGFASFPLPWNIVAGLGAPIVAILVWALFLSPKAVFVTHPFVQAVIELLVYVAVTAAWWSLGYAWVGLAFAVVAVTIGLIVGLRKLR